MLIASLAGFNLLGIGLGLAVFLSVLLFMATRQPVYQALRRPAVRRAIVDVFYLRLVMVICLPLALTNDLICGALSMLAVEAVLGTATGIAEAAAATILEGTLLTVELALLTCLAFLERRESGYAMVPTDVCVRCGYDLRAGGSIRCPECGLERAE